MWCIINNLIGQWAYELSMSFWKFYQILDFFKKSFERTRYKVYFADSMQHRNNYFKLFTKRGIVKNVIAADINTLFLWKPIESNVYKRFWVDTYTFYTISDDVLYLPRNKILLIRFGTPSINKAFTIFFLITNLSKRFFIFNVIRANLCATWSLYIICWKKARTEQSSIKWMICRIFRRRHNSTDTC